MQGLHGCGSDCHLRSHRRRLFSRAIWPGSSEIRKASTLPVLRKDFVFDHFQIYETRGAGASAILLIVAMLKQDEIRSFLELAKEVKLDALVEVHDERELGEALEAGAEIIGVNNRNLKTFEVNLNTSFRLSRTDSR